MTTEPRPPRGTGPAGRALWSSVVSGFDLEPHEVRVLAQCCTVADHIAELDAIVLKDGPLLDGRTHPALVEVRLQRLTLGRLLALLRLPDREEHRPQRRGGFRRPYRLRQVIGGDGGA
jgi:hypothetical protein